MYISFNASAVIANNSLNKTDKNLQSSLARLSSGLKVVNPKDNPSGLAMAKRMNAQIEGTKQANNNSSDGVSIIEIADGTMGEISEMLQRMNELAVKACNGTMTEDDRVMIDKEIQQLKDEVTRIAKETTFNGQPLLDGSFDLKGYTDNLGVKVSYYSDDVTYGKYQLDGLKVEFNDDGTIKSVADPLTVNGTDGPIENLKTTVSGNTVTVKNGTGWELKLEVPAQYDTSTTPKTLLTSLDLTSTINMDLTGIGSMDMQIGANEGQQLAIRIPRISLENMEIANIKTMGDDEDGLNSDENCADALDRIKQAMRYVSAARADLGAYQNRLEHTINSLDITEENMTSAYSRIMDVDMAEEMTEYTTLQILSQSSTSMLAQANERPSQVLQLLQ